MSEIEACQLTVEPFYQCCCNCKLRAIDQKHCSIHGRAGGKCVCHEVKGFVCLGFVDEGVVHSEWPEHSCGCELYLPRVKHSAAMGESEYLSWGVPQNGRDALLLNWSRKIGAIVNAG